jgi:hypothetical protein
MRKISLLLFLGLIVVCGTAEAGRFPSRLVYLFYAHGQYVGRCVVEAEEKADVYEFKSSSEVRIGIFVQSMECFTEFNKETLAPKYYSYRGEKVGQKMSGVIEFTEETIKGDLEFNGAPIPSEQATKGQIILYENYVMDHQTMMLATLAASGEPYVRFHTFSPSDFVQAQTVALVESEVELPLKPKPSVCTKWAISLQSADPYFGYFDPERQVAVYMDYPLSGVEIFLESAWGENPPTHYTPPPKEDQGAE